MEIISIHKDVIGGQCYGCLARIQFFYTAFFIGVGVMPKGWQGLQFGFFAPAHNSKVGYRAIKFYASLLPAMPGPVAQWPTWYKWSKKQMTTCRYLLNGFK